MSSKKMDRGAFASQSTVAKSIVRLPVMGEAISYLPENGKNLSNDIGNEGAKENAEA